MALAYVNYGQPVTATPQSQPIPGREHEMLPNNAGGYSFQLDDWERLNRFLVVGSEGGSYYVNERNLTAQNADAVIRCIKADGPRVVTLAQNINLANRAPKVDSQLFALALALKHGDAATKRAVYGAAQSMLRTGTHLLHFVAMLDSLGGWNRSKRSIVQAWFEQAIEPLSFQMLKYQNRDGWRMGDALRLVHPKPLTESHNTLFAWATGKLDLFGEVCPARTHHESVMPSVLVAHTAMNAMPGTPVEKALWGIQHMLPREALPTEALASVEVQRAQLPHLPIHALIRNLGSFTSSGLFDDEASMVTVVKKLTDRTNLMRSRVHPFAVLLATLVYKLGHGVRGGKTWTPNNVILSCLEDAYDLAFNNVTPTNKRLMIGIDISGSMDKACVGSPIPAITAAAAMAITLARLEPHATVIQFDTEYRNFVNITKRTGIASLQQASGGGTDLSAPVRWALEKAREFDAFVILTDNETWAGRQHPTQALLEYRRKVNQNAKLICCSMAANHASIVDPSDALQFGCAGLDSYVPGLVGDFIDR